MSRENTGADTDRGISHHSSERFSVRRRSTAGAGRPKMSRRPASSQAARMPTMPTQMKISNSAKPCP